MIDEESAFLWKREKIVIEFMKNSVFEIMLSLGLVKMFSKFNETIEAALRQLFILSMSMHKAYSPEIN